MQMLYNSASFVVVLFDVPVPATALDPVFPASPVSTVGEGMPALSRGGYEIVDKLARKEIFIEGALAERFKLGVQSLVESGPTEEKLDEFIAGFTGMAQQAVVLH
ncbi:MAG: DUF3567 domain-containing protein [Chitinophagaceae bacterium]|nr:DUF3567 domain-containing protein [Rubrivivax sp.]